MSCIFGNRCVSKEHGVGRCQTALMRDGQPRLPCFVCELRTTGATTMFGGRTPLCWRCYMSSSDEKLTALKEGKPIPGRKPLYSGPRQ